MSDIKHSELFAAWLDGTLSDKQRGEFERICALDPEFAEQVELANNVSMLAQDYRPEPVPEWNKSVTFEREPAPKWWQWQGFSVVAFGCSMLAILLVVSGFQIEVQNGAITMRFNNAIDHHQLDQLVEKRLQQHRVEQAKIMTDYAQILRQQQLDASTQLTNYLLASSRQERREDFGEFIKFINQQRNEDQVFFARQLNQLQQQLYASPKVPARFSDGSYSAIND